MTLLQTIIISIVEGLTEFLPVSSTGHMIITQNLLGVPSGDEFVHAFTFIIQFGAILSVVCLYWKRFFQIDHTPVPADKTCTFKKNIQSNPLLLVIVHWCPNLYFQEDLFIQSASTG